MSGADAVLPGLTPSLSRERERERGCAELGDFDALVRTHRERVVRFLLGMIGDREVAEDLAQECFLRAHQARHEFRGEASAGTWLIRIAINLASDYRRSKRLQFWRSLARHTSEDDVRCVFESFADDRPNAERSLIARQQAARVWDAARRLSANQRLVFMLRFVDEMGIAEIAKSASMAEGTVKVHLSRAVHAIRKNLREG
ncbi:MAG: sigma-70 family RNA polymerase sigma factor [Acidobacteria bacterium]|nr:sigma-70 family RNA polymerase sigma factor [Acidobacteriota bacterium]